MDQSTHCRHGHEYAPENTYYPPSGRRICRACQIRAQRDHRERRRAAISTSLVEACARCGNEEPASRMHWHHRDPVTKLFDVSKGHHYTPAAVAAEIAKCDRICTTCHTQIHIPHGPRKARAL